MQQHKKLAADASKSEEYKHDMEGLQVTVESMRTAYEQLRVDFKESDTNVLHLTKKLDDANAAQKAEGLRGSLEASEKGRNDAEAEIVRLLDQKNEMEKKMESVEADYVENFHNTEVYTNFSDYFAKVGHQEVLAALILEYPDFSISSLEARFPPPDDGDDC
ncbi:hypothetical protein Adt_23402 [Abeliophyllum distichum]|uniref:Uncharacterized protein n=1 Tax=Abeliophyllum distichum TaxID=126358 RepID=A0ABD1SAS7_9LAMI